MGPQNEMVFFTFIFFGIFVSLRHQFEIAANEEKQLRMRRRRKRRRRRRRRRRRSWPTKRNDFFHIKFFRHLRLRHQFEIAAYEEKQLRRRRRRRRRGGGGGGGGGGGVRGGGGGGGRRRRRRRSGPTVQLFNDMT